MNHYSPGLFQVFKIIVLLYADDTILLSENPAELQKCIDDFMSYCAQWKLNVNICKTKVQVFGSRNSNQYQFKIGETQLEIVDHYKYLGVYFSK